MKKLLWLLAVVALLPIGILAATKGDPMPNATYGAVNVDTSATAVPTTPISGRNAFAISNLGPSTIYCGWDASVTSSTGFPVPTGGGVLSVDITYIDAPPSRPKLFCIASALQVSPANTRYLEVK